MILVARRSFSVSKKYLKDKVRRLKFPVLLLIFALVAAVALLPQLKLLGQTRPELAQEKTVGTVEPVAYFNGPMLTGVTISRSGRIFVNFPRWGDPVQFTVAEVKEGRTVPYPNLAINRLDQSRQSDSLVSVQSVVIDPRDRLWILDTGSINFSPTSYGGPKLIGIDLQQNRIFKKSCFPKM